MNAAPNGTAATTAVADPPALSPAAEAARDCLLALPDADREAALDAVALAVASEAEPAATPWPPADSPLGRRQRAELDRRLAAMDAGEVEYKPLSEVTRRLRETVLRWDRERAAGVPYTPYEVAGRSITPDCFEDGSPQPESGG